MSARTPSSAQRFAGLPWLFSPGVDLAAFLGSCLAALALLAVGAGVGVLDGSTPEWTWVPAILLIDVAHVYSTCFRVYFQPQEFLRRRWLYVLVPLLSYAFSWAVYTESSELFWRLLAYAAVFHFVRQQYGWVAMYRAREGETGRFGKWVDAAAIYLATVYPLIFWHANLPRQFWWFVESDFARVPQLLVPLVQPIYGLAMITYFGRSLLRGWRHGLWNPGKDIVVLTTALCWYLGIITFNSDFAFTVTNVIIHGVPYMVLVYWFQRRPRSAGCERARTWQHTFVFLGTLWLLAYAEELLWDRGLWHERAWLFGPAWKSEGLRYWLVPLLAVPQLTHYVLDGFIWRRKSNPELSKVLSLSPNGR